MLTPPRSLRGAGATGRITRRSWVLAAVVALLWVQALGFMHRVAHEPPAGAGMHLQQRVDGERSAHAGWLQALFAQHENATDCRLYDGLVSGGLAVHVSLALAALALPVRYLRPSHENVFARPAAPFEARGPPLSR